MKKYFLIAFLSLFCILMVGCGKNSEKDIINELDKKIEKIEGYYLNGELEIINHEDSYLYDVEVAYQKDDNFRVSLKNKTNNHEQIILKNSEGVYVLTPSLNKSFKFQSEWPYNNSQVYLLQTILKDLKQDENRIFEQLEEGYLFTTKVNYSNSDNLNKQKITMDKNLNIKQVIVLNQKDQEYMKMNFNSIDYKATYDDSYFTLQGNMKNVETTTTSKTLDSIIYPMYIPENTQLSGQERIETTNGERVILTFSGDNPFMLVQENVSVSEEILTIPMYGEPEIITGTVGALSSSSVTWVNNGVEFYIVSDTLTSSELLDVANSINVVTVSK